MYLYVSGPAWCQLHLALCIARYICTYAYMPSLSACACHSSVSIATNELFLGSRYFMHLFSLLPFIFSF
jgi:hypothetical protein